MDKVKVLITGPIKGSLSAFCSKLRSLQKSKAGPFHICFCVGPLFESSSNPDEAKYILKEGTPLPVYFCDIGTLPPGIPVPGPPTDLDNQDSAEIDIDADDCDDENENENENENEIGNGNNNGNVDANGNANGNGNANKNGFDGVVKIATNLYHLHGIPISHDSKPTADIINIDVPDCNGYITVSFLPPNSRLGTAQTSTLETKAHHPSFVGCDILLTSHWGQGMAYSNCLPDYHTALNQQQQQQQPNIIDEVGSFDVAEIASQCRPRYHFAPAIHLSNNDHNNNNNSTDTDININTNTNIRFIQSLPYTNPPSSLASGAIQNYHTSRFIALCPFTHIKMNKKDARAKKSIHALGIQPLWSMDPSSATAIPEGLAVVPSPYTDEGYIKDQSNANNIYNKCTNTNQGITTAAINNGETPHIEIPHMENTATTRNIGLSQAQTRRLLMEEGTDNQYRWNIRNNNKKRPMLDQSEQHNQLQIAAANDLQNCTLFLYGLHKDTNDGTNINRDTLLQVFQPLGCIDVRYPATVGLPPDNTNRYTEQGKKFCFLDFNLHSQAEKILRDTGGTMELSGVTLTLKWSSGRSANSGPPPPPPPPPPGAPSLFPTMMGHHRPGMYGMVPPPPPPPPPPGGRSIPPPPPQKRQRRERLTETEAVDSTTLFLHLNVQSCSGDKCCRLIQSVGQLAQAMLEEAINGDADVQPAEDGDNAECDTDWKKDDKETTTAPLSQVDPALNVNARTLAKRDNCGFLDFASHAAASMALATLTGNVDGGIIMPDVIDKAKNWDKMVHEVQLWWSKPHLSKEGDQKEGNGPQLRKHHFPADARKDCWFCLASPTCEKHLIVTVYNSCYITMPKGAVNQHHTLIVPVNHSTPEGEGKDSHKRILGAFLDPSPGVEDEVRQALSQLRRHASGVLGKDLFVFERAIPTRGGYHAHINCIPVERGLGPKLQSIMMAMATRGDGFDLREIQNDNISLATILRNADDDEALIGYFYAEIPLGECGAVKRLLYKAKGGGNLKSIENGTESETQTRTPFVPLQFGRDVLASALGDENIANWKGCTVSKEKEEEWTQQFRTSFNS